MTINFLYIYCSFTSFVCVLCFAFRFAEIVWENVNNFSSHLEQPDVPLNLECRGVSSRSVKLSWKRPFDGNSPMLSYIVQYQPTKFAHLSILNSEDHWNSPNTMNITLPNISIGKRYVYMNVSVCMCDFHQLWNCIQRNALFEYRLNWRLIATYLCLAFNDSWRYLTRFTQLNAMEMSKQWCIDSLTCLFYVGTFQNYFCVCLCVHFNGNLINFQTNFDLNSQIYTFSNGLLTIQRENKYRKVTI